jgi:hypothetical protein
MVAVRPVAPRAVHQHVEAVVPSEHILGQRPDLCLGRLVRQEQLHAIVVARGPQLGHGRLALGRVTRHDPHPSAKGRQRGRGGLADAGGGPGHQAHPPRHGPALAHPRRKRASRRPIRAGTLMRRIVLTSPDRPLRQRRLDSRPAHTSDGFVGAIGRRASCVQGPSPTNVRRINQRSAVQPSRSDLPPVDARTQLSWQSACHRGIFCAKLAERFPQVDLGT